MIWIASFPTLRTNKNLKLLCDELKISRKEAIGLLHCLWWWAAVHREDGDLSGLFDNDIAAACDWEGDSKSLVKTLHDTGWLVNYRIADWMGHVGMLLNSRQRTRRWREKRNGDVTGNVTGDVTETFLSRPRVEKSRVDKSIYINTIAQEQWFNELWNEYPTKGRVGKKKAFKYFTNSITNPKDLEQIKLALQNYKASDRVRGGVYIQNASTWFNNWQDWIDKKPTEATSGFHSIVV